MPGGPQAGRCLRRGRRITGTKNTPLRLGQNTYYFRTSFVLPVLPDGTRLQLRTVIDDGAVFYLNGREIFRQNIPAGIPVDFNTPASLVDNAVLTGPFALPGTGLVAGTNVLAVEVHQVNSTSSDIVFGCSLDLEGGTVAPRTPGAPNSLRLDLPEFPPVWISEVLPLNTEGLADGSGMREPWIELVNRGDDPIPLAGWFLSDSATAWDRWAFPGDAVLSPRSHVVIFADGQPSKSTPSEWHTSFRLEPSGGVVVLARPQLGGLAVMDYLRHSGLPSNTSAIPDADGIAGSSRPASPTPGDPDTPNRPPRLAAVARQEVPMGLPWRFTLVATDPDPYHRLAFSLVRGPAGMTVSPRGVLLWTPAPNQLGVQDITIRVTDDGVPPLADEVTFQAAVTAAMAVRIAVEWSGDQLQLVFTTVEGLPHRIEGTRNLAHPDWRLLQEFNGSGGSVRWPLADAAGLDPWYFRVVVP